MAKKIQGKPKQTRIEREVEEAWKELEPLLAEGTQDAIKASQRLSGFKDGYYAASVTVDEVIQAVRVDIENADLSGAAQTAAKLALEMVGRLWYERKQEVNP